MRKIRPISFAYGFTKVTKQIIAPIFLYSHWGQRRGGTSVECLLCARHRPGCLFIFISCQLHNTLHGQVLVCSFILDLKKLKSHYWEEAGPIFDPRVYGKSPDAPMVACCLPLLNNLFGFFHIPLASWSF